MKIEVKRKELTDESTIGDLYIDGSLFCNTLEDVIRLGSKVFGKTAIPAGEYNVIVDYSPHFGKDMPHLLNVNGFTGVRIHSGNKPEDTEGCILVGVYTPGHMDWIGNSRVTYDALFSRIQKALQNNEEITITIT